MGVAIGRMLERPIILIVAFFFFLSAFVDGGLRKSGSQAAAFGDLFPQYAFPYPPASEDRGYLGIPAGETFTISDVQADLIVLEVLNIYCTSCQKQAPISSEVFRMVESDPVTRGRIRWMGVGVGNNQKEVDYFRKEKKIPFPILQDVNFEFYDAVGGPGGVRTPLTLLVRKDEDRRGIVVESHIGFRSDKHEIFQGIKAALLYDLAYLKIKEGDRAVLPVTKKLTPPMSDADLLTKIKKGMAIEGASILAIHTIHLKDEVIYVGKARAHAQEKQLFAKVVSRPPVCDICHDIHFIYIFDEEGKVINLVPLQLPKYANRPWDDDDIEKMKSRIIGRTLLETFQFDRNVDAVSGATITSVIIFDSLNKGKSIYSDLMREDYVK
jgi:hypothetical protein